MKEGIDTHDGDSPRGVRGEVRETELQLILPRAPAEVLRRALVVPWGSMVVFIDHSCRTPSPVRSLTRPKE